MNRRPAVPPAEGGRARVLVSPDGRYALAGEALTAGERHWAPAPQKWVDVDVTMHTLASEVSFGDAGGRAGFVASVDVQCSVEDPGAAARLGVRSVRGYLEPLLAEAVARAGASIATGAGDPVGALARARSDAERAVREELSGGWEAVLPPWLAARVVRVSVRLDADTERHRRELVHRQRTGELVDAGAVVKSKETEYEIEQRRRWREELSPHLENPARRQFEAVLSDPTPEKIAALVDRLEQVDQIGLRATVEIMQELIRKEYPGTPEWEAVVDALRNVFQRLPGGASPLLGGAKQADELESPDAEHPPTIEGESTTDPGPVVDEEPDDRDWSDR